MKRILAAASIWLLAAGVWAGTVDANTASREELQSIRGIGPATSARIVDERRRQPFRDPQDLAHRVKGIGERKLAKMIEAGLTVGGNGVQIVAGRGEPPARERKRRAVVMEGVARPAPASAQGSAPSQASAPAQRPASAQGLARRDPPGR